MFEEIISQRFLLFIKEATGPAGTLAVMYAVKAADSYTLQPAIHGTFWNPNGFGYGPKRSALLSEPDCLQDVLDLVARIFCLQGFNLRHTNIREKRISSFYFVQRGRGGRITQSILASHLRPTLLPYCMQLVGINLQEEKSSHLILSVIRVSVSCVCPFICSDLKGYHAVWY